MSSTPSSSKKNANPKTPQKPKVSIKKEIEEEDKTQKTSLKRKQSVREPIVIGYSNSEEQEEEEEEEGEFDKEELFDDEQQHNEEDHDFYETKESKSHVPKVLMPRIHIENVIAVLKEASIMMKNMCPASSMYPRIESLTVSLESVLLRSYKSKGRKKQKEIETPNRTEEVKHK